jgi:nitrogen fixation protein FixH
MTRKFTGRHIAAILVAFFGVVIAVNFTMAWLANSTFGGLVVKNSYVASQKYNEWLQKARDEKALGWTLAIERASDGRVQVAIASGEVPLRGGTVVATARHPVGREPDVTLQFRPLEDGRYESADVLPEGRWIVHVRASVNGQQINRVVDLS